MDQLAITTTARLRERRTLVVSFAVVTSTVSVGDTTTSIQPEIWARVGRVLRLDGALFNYLNNKGAFDIYEDWRRPMDERVENHAKAPPFAIGSGLSWATAPLTRTGPGREP